MLVLRGLEVSGFGEGRSHVPLRSMHRRLHYSQGLALSHTVRKQVPALLFVGGFVYLEDPEEGAAEGICARGLIEKFKVKFGFQMEFRDRFRDRFSPKCETGASDLLRGGRRVRSPPHHL